MPSDLTQDELRVFLDQLLPPLSPAQTEPQKDRQQVYGGVSTVFLISRLSRTLRFAFIFEVVIIRYDKVARDRGIVHMIITRALTTPDCT